jgi:hypothetical protein
MTESANPRDAIPEEAPAEPRRPIPVSRRRDLQESRPVDPLAPGGSLFDEDDDAVEPNEPG